MLRFLHRKDFCTLSRESFYLPLIPSLYPSFWLSLTLSLKLHSFIPPCQGRRERQRVRICSWPGSLRTYGSNLRLDCLASVHQFIPCDAMGENPSRVLRVLYFSADDAGADQGKIDCGLMDVKTFSNCNAALAAAFSWNIAMEFRETFCLNTNPQ